MEEIMARGLNFVFAKKFIQKEYGNETFNRAFDSLPQEAKEIWQDAVIIGSYPFPAFKAMTAVLSVELGTLKDREIAKMYEYIADRSLSVLYKMFFKMTNPSFVIKNYPKLWSRFFKSGEVEVPVAEKCYAKVRFILPEIFLDWLPPACLGYSKKAVEMAGGKNLVMKLERKSLLPDKSWEIIYVLKWEEG